QLLDSPTMRTRGRAAGVRRLITDFGRGGESPRGSRDKDHTQQWGPTCPTRCSAARAKRQGCCSLAPLAVQTLAYGDDGTGQDCPDQRTIHHGVYLSPRATAS